MKIIVVDDEPLVLNDMERILKETLYNCELTCFCEPDKALAYVRSISVDVAFLDIELGNMNGIALAKSLKDIQSDIHIIFTTSHQQYAVDAFALHATGYLLKPIMNQDIQRELTFLYGKLDQGNKIRVQTFGGFEVFVNENPLLFKRTKSKELLAILIDRRGMAVTTREACSLLWEEELYSVSKKNYFQIILSDLRSTLREAKSSGILIKDWNRLSIDPNSLDCDYYRFLAGEPRAINSYRHDYLPNYSWAEFTMGSLEEQYLTIMEKYYEL